MCYFSLSPSIFPTFFSCHFRSLLRYYGVFFLPSFAGIKYTCTSYVFVLCIVRNFFHTNNFPFFYYLPSFDTVHRFANLCSARKSFMAFQLYCRIRFLPLPSLLTTTVLKHTVLRIARNLFSFVVLFFFSADDRQPGSYLSLLPSLNRFTEYTLFILNRRYFYWKTSTYVFAHFVCVYVDLAKFKNNNRKKMKEEDENGGVRPRLFSFCLFFAYTLSTLCSSISKQIITRVNDGKWNEIK